MGRRPDLSAPRLTAAVCVCRQFRGIAVTDAGRYVCTAENSAGRAEGVAEVIVSGEWPAPGVSSYWPLGGVALGHGGV